jgi:hypothetical protein
MESPAYDSVARTAGIATAVAYAWARRRDREDSDCRARVISKLFNKRRPVVLRSSCMLEPLMPAGPVK